MLEETVASLAAYAWKAIAEDRTATMAKNATTLLIEHFIIKPSLLIFILDHSCFLRKIGAPLMHPNNNTDCTRNPLIGHIMAFGNHKTGIEVGKEPSV